MGPLVSIYKLTIIISNYFKSGLVPLLIVVERERSDREARRPLGRPVG